MRSSILLKTSTQAANNAVELRKIGVVSVRVVGLLQRRNFKRPLGGVAQNFFDGEKQKNSDDETTDQGTWNIQRGYDRIRWRWARRQIICTLIVPSIRQ